MKVVKRIKETNDKIIQLVEENNTYYIEKILSIYDLSLYQTLQSLHNEHIPTIYQIQECKDGLHILEEYIDGEVLGNHIHTKKEVKDIIHQLCLCLEQVHSVGIVHRDIKPENIMIKDKKVYLIDFDIARFIVKDQSTDTQILGSVGYAAPEQFGFKQSNARTDIYALGKTMCYLLSHDLNIRKGMPYYFIMYRATQMDPMNRFKSVKEFDQALYHKPWIYPCINDVNRKDKIISWFWLILIIAFVFSYDQNDNTEFKYFFNYLLAVFFVLYFILFVYYNKKHNQWGWIQSICIYIFGIFGFIFLLTMIESML